MATLKSLRQRIKSINETQKITSAMMLVAGSKLRRAQLDLEKTRPYVDGFEKALGALSSLSQAEIITNPFLRPNANPKKYLLILMTSDRGLCGGFNAGIAREIKMAYASLISQGKSVRILPLGRKGREILKSTHGDAFWLPETLEENASSNVTEKSQVLTTCLEQSFLDGTFDQIMCFSSKFQSVMKQSIQAQKILPIQISASQNSEIALSTHHLLYSFEPKVESFLMPFLHDYLFATLYTNFLESLVCEQAARMMAMDGATRNAKDIIHRLKLTYNRSRQATITKELIEIISGAEALQ